MENKINVSNFLKDCPSGIELNCLMYEDVYFDYVDELNIIHCYIQYKTYKTSLEFSQYGTPNNDTKSKCVIFPKGKTTWEGFQRPFKDGDIVYTRYDNKDGYIFIFESITENTHVNSYLHLKGDDLRIIKTWLTDCDDKYLRYATEEEKQKLFDAIKANGYKWNAETKTLDKLPKFKVGDKIVKKNNISVPIEITSADDEFYYSKTPNSVGVLPIKDQDDWELAVEPKFKVGDKIRHKETVLSIVNVGENKYVVEDTPKNYGLLTFSTQDNWELVPNKFDIAALKPFDKVLVRCNSLEKWHIQFFEKYNTELGAKYPFICLCNSKYCQCIPYEGNEHLLGTTNDCDEYYKTW